MRPATAFRECPTAWRTVGPVSWLGQPWKMVWHLILWVSVSVRLDGQPHSCTTAGSRIHLSRYLPGGRARLLKTSKMSAPLACCSYLVRSALRFVCDSRASRSSGSAESLGARYAALIKLAQETVFNEREGHRNRETNARARLCPPQTTNSCRRCDRMSLR
jgi:hypothetical protein